MYTQKTLCLQQYDITDITADWVICKHVGIPQGIFV